MNWKIASAFAAGAVMASGIVYMAVRPVPIAKPDPAPFAALPPPPAPAPPAAVETPAKPEPVVAPPPIEKPSPMPPPVRREKPVVVARNQPPKQPAPPPEPAPEPKPAAPVTPPPVVVETPPPVPELQPEPAPPPSVASKPEEAPPPPDVEERVPHTVTIAAGTALPVRIGETISSSRNQVGDSFLATLDSQLVVDGFIIAERGSRLEGRVLESGRSGGTNGLEIVLVRLSTADGQRVRIRTEPYKKDVGGGSTGSDIARIGAGAAIGAAIGAIAGGGKGAAIGAAAGGAAGAGTVLISHNKSAEIPVESRVTFRIQEPVTITEKLN